MEPAFVVKNDKGIGDFCTCIEHATNRLARKKEGEIDRDVIADRLDACANAVRKGNVVDPFESRREIDTRKKEKKGGKQVGLAKRKKKKKTSA